MHDPQTVAFDIKAPWTRKGYRPTLVTIWHVDPERDGSDDSCGWSYPKLTQDQRRRIRDFAWHEGRDPYFLREAGKEWTGSRTEAETLYRALVLLTARAVRVPLTYEAASLYASQRVHNGGFEDAARNFCWLPGYHCNGADSAERRQDYFAGIMAGIARGLLADARPWYRHPKWHVHHWKLQFHTAQAFKRWAFSRCAGCGGRFAFGYCPVSHQWDGVGPRWFRGEPHVYHSECSAKKAAP
jgi:hypothetical protein